MLLRVSKVCISVVCSFFIVVVFHCMNVPHWGRYQFLIIISRAAIKIHVQVYSNYLRVRLLYDYTTIYGKTS